MIFIQNKYTAWYFSIINKAKIRKLASDIYVEKHHIIPSSLGGTNSGGNIVKLTAKEHFVCHLLLTKMTCGNSMYKMKYALNMISNAKNIGNGRYVPSGRMYEYIRKCHKDAIRNIWTEEKRKTHSEKLKAYQLDLDRTTPDYIQRIDRIREQQKTKIWTDKALNNLKEIGIRSAEKRKGVKNPKHSEFMFESYVKQNRDLIIEIWNLNDSGLNRRQISFRLGISWDRVNIAIRKKSKILEVLEKISNIL